MDPSQPDELAEAHETTRQRIARWLGAQELDFETLRDALGLSSRALERELQHVARSARREGRHLEVEPPRCRACGFGFPGRTRRHLHPPGRCPRCRAQRIDPPRFRLRPRGGR